MLLKYCMKLVQVVLCYVGHDIYRTVIVVVITVWDTDMVFTKLCDSVGGGIPTTASLVLYLYKCFAGQEFCGSVVVAFIYSYDVMGTSTGISVGINLPLARCLCKQRIVV